MLIKNQHSHLGNSNSISQASHSANQEFKITHHNESSHSDNLSTTKKTTLAKKTSGGSHQQQELYSSTASAVNATNNNSIVSKSMDSTTELNSKIGNHKIQKRNSKLNNVVSYYETIFKFVFAL